MFVLFKPGNLKHLPVLLLCTLLVTPSFSIEADKSASIDRYRQALEVDPDNLTLYYILGLAQLKIGAYDDAIVAFRTAYPAYTDSIEMHYNTRLAFSQAGDADSVLLYLEQAEFLGALKWDLASTLEKSLPEILVLRKECRTPSLATMSTLPLDCRGLPIRGRS